jgi:hypothetical protein
MDIKYYGANCVKITDKNIVLTIDDNLDKLGLKNVSKEDDICVFTDPNTLDYKGRFIINGPGEYEISGVSINGIPVKDQLNQQEGGSVVYRLESNNMIIAVLGHISPDLNDDQLELLGVIDLLLLPVGGNGFTIDPHGAAQLIKKIEPKIVIPTHFEDKAVKYEVPQAALSAFLKELGVDEAETKDSFRLKESELTDKTRIIVLNRA